jgi:hypothetical protein
MRSLISLCVGALALSGCGATTTSLPPLLASNSLVAGPALRASRASLVKDDPLAAEPAEDHDVNAKRDAVATRDPDPYRQVIVREVTKFGMITLVSTARGDDPNGASATRARETAPRGSAAITSGSIWSDSIDDSAGSLALSGIGEGGGGLGGGIAYSGIGNLGDGSDKGAPEIVARAQTDLGREEGIVRSPRPVALAATTDASVLIASNFVIDRRGNVAVAAAGGLDAERARPVPATREYGTLVTSLGPSTARTLATPNPAARVLRSAALDPRWRYEEGL